MKPSLSPDTSHPIAQGSMPERPFLEFHAKKQLHTAQGRQWLDIHFHLEKGQTLAIYGPSGAGKTTLLRILAGLTEVSEGSIRLGDETWLDTTLRINQPTRHRAIGFVFQDFALFPNLTVRQQLEYALPQGEDSHLITELLSLMELEALQHHRPTRLSGGQQQRVALARAIARRPSLLLLDEPLSALDDEMRNKLQDYLLKVQQRFHLTTILVSHHLPEIHRLADTVLTLKHGHIAAQGAPSTLFPQSPQLTLPATILAIIEEADRVLLTVHCAGSDLTLTIPPAQAATLAIGQRIDITFNTSDPTLTLR